MSSVLVVKNWERFQHYKDRDPPWVKFYRDTLTSESWVLGTDASRLVQSASILLAARYGNKTPYRFDLIRKVAHLEMDERKFAQAVEHLVAHNFLEIQEVTNEKESPLQVASSVLAKCSSETEQSRDRADISSAEPTAHPLARTVPRGAEPQWFLDFKLAYPDRAGEQGWRRALRAANARMAEGHSTAEMIDGARRYAAFCAATGKVGTEFVKLPATFLGPEKSFLQPWAPPVGARPAARDGLLPDALEVAARQWGSNGA